ncbi:hypothetical protein PTQ21_28420 [Paenibacillus marchantiae]|uniref:hypothetical protein n=1 Tax=Paenibacillus marchantiae TaxID=3026433 RepID=UPI00237B9364|nr:hypothetical protein [Paenibacillus marchantiae]WDQ32257.1 hypothetical protein PTQ21_28420 [Paenibacillus marchantiae]
MSINKWLRKILLVMFSVVLLSIPIISLFPDYAEAKCTYVSGYTKKNGTRVSGYYRGCGTVDSNSSYNSYTPTYTEKTETKNYYGLSNTINLYKGQNYAGTTDTENLVYVNGYYRKDGTYVRPHYRTHPNHYINDNFSYLGISSLIPHTKYPRFTFNSDVNISLKENYLLYSLSDYNLNEKQLNMLKTYTLNLKEAELDRQFEQNVVTTGKQLYTSLGLDEITAYNKIRFDLTGDLSFEDYLYNVAYSFNPTFKKSFGDFPILETYAYLLKESKSDSNMLKITKNYGSKFYKFIGADASSIESQIEMDLLQTFESNQSVPLMPPFSLLNTANGAFTKGAVRTYLINEGAHLNITFNSHVILDATPYQASLELLYNGSYSFLNSSIIEGIKFYTKYGLSTNEATNQTIKDINVILAS